MTRAPRVALVLFGLAVAGDAGASNANLPRTPVIHTGERCMTVVDRAVDPVVELTYTIPFPDTCLGDDDVPGSRTQQFVAFCRGIDPSERLPQWTNHADVDLAEEHDLLPDVLPTPDDVLDVADAWQGCFARIVADDMRRPIHCDEAADPVAWDTIGVAAGAWVVQGYTFDPPTNLWRPRRGVIKVVDGAGDDPPAAAIAAHPIQLGTQNELPLSVCVDAAPGSTVRASWSPVDMPSWTEFDTREVDDGTFELAFVPPATTVALQVMLEVVVEDGEGRSFRYASPDVVTIVPGDHPPPTPLPIYDFCAEHEGAFEPQNCSGGGEDEGDDGTTKPSCACTTDRHASPAWCMLALVVVRRRRAFKGPCTPGRAKGTWSGGTSRSAARPCR